MKGPKAQLVEATIVSRNIEGRKTPNPKP